MSLNKNGISELSPTKAAEALRRLIINHDLPRTDMALYGIKCPYCGKSDRIRKLEHPLKLSSRLESSTHKQYRDCWHQLSNENEPLGVCKFCENPVKLEGTSKALQLDAGF